MTDRSNEATRTAPASRPGLFARLLAAILRADQAYRDRRHVERLTDEQLRDARLDTQSQNRAFYGKYGRSPQNDAPASIETRFRA